MSNDNVLTANGLRLADMAQKVSVKDGDVVLINARLVDCKQLADTWMQEASAPEVLLVPVIPAPGQTLRDAFEVSEVGSALLNLYLGLLGASKNGTGYSPIVATAMKKLKELGI